MLLWVGCVVSIDVENNELLINFLHNNVGALNHFFYPEREDKCLVLVTSIVSKLATPNVSRNARKYFLTESDFIMLQNLC